MKKKMLHSLLGIVVAGLLLLSPVSSLTLAPDFASCELADAQARTLTAASTDAAVVGGKSEVVYATLTATGQVDAVYTVNHFEIESAGSLTDYGRYDSVHNLSTTDALQQSGGVVTAQVETGDFYYQGNLSNAQLPWMFDVRYTLDGVPIEPQDLAGRSGGLGIQIVTAQNTQATPGFYENYMLQISLTLNAETCSGLSAPGATIAEAGKNRMVNFTVLPGKDADLTLSATVRDFEMSGFDVSAIPFSMSFELPDTDNMTGEFTQLSDAIASLNDGVSKLHDGVGELNDGSKKLAKGSGEIQKGLTTLKTSAGQLTGASAQIKNALGQIPGMLDGGDSLDLSQLSQLAQLPQGLEQLATGLRQVSGGLTQLGAGFGPAYQALDAAVAQIPETMLTEQQLGVLYTQVDPGQFGVLDTLVNSYTAAQTVRGTYLQVKAAFDAVGTTLATLSGTIDTMAQELDGVASGLTGAMNQMSGLDQLSQLAAGLQTLSDNYDTFHQGLLSYTGGVSQLAGQYGAFNSGVSELSGGVGALLDGTGELADGTAQLSDETADLPDRVQQEIDAMLDETLGGDYQPVSFLSDQNTEIDLVQFVFKCGGVQKPKAVTTVVAETKTEKNFWDRLTALFSA